MTYNRLKNKRVLITQSEDYMGQDIKDLFEEEGAIVFADNRDLTPDIAAKNLVDAMVDKNLSFYKMLADFGLLLQMFDLGA